MPEEFIYDEKTRTWSVNPNLKGDAKRRAEDLLAKPEVITILDKELAKQQWSGALNGITKDDNVFMNGTQLTQDPFKLNDFINKAGNWRIDNVDDNLTAKIGNIFNDRVTATTPQGYNKADTNSIFNSMSDIKGSTFGGAYAALGAYNLMDINEGMTNYAKNEANDPLNKDNLKPFVTMGDSGFANPLAAKYGAIVNYGKVQSEKDEVTVLPDGSIVDSASKSFHKNMDSDEITEYLPQGSLVFSNKVMVKKDKFKKDEDDIIASTASNYKETEKPDLPKQFRVSDLFGGKKEMSSAELIKKIREMFPIKEASDDETAPAKLMPLDMRTNEMNKMARMPYIAAIFDKVKGKMSITPTEEGETEDTEESKPTKAFVGTTVMAALAAAQLIGTGISQWQANKQKKENMKLLNEGLTTGKKLLTDTTTLSALANFAQDPVVPASNFDYQRALLTQRPDSMPSYMYESLSNQQSADNSLRTRSLFENTTSFNKAANAASAYDVNYLKARNDLMFNVAEKNLSLADNRRMALYNLANEQRTNRDYARTATTQNANAQMSNAANIFTNYGNQSANLQYGYDAAKVGVNAAYANTTMGNVQGLTQGLTNIAGLYKPSSAATPNAQMAAPNSSFLAPTLDNTTDLSEVPYYGEVSGMRTGEKTQYDFYNQLYNNAAAPVKANLPNTKGDVSLVNPLQTLPTDLPTKNDSGSHRLEQAQGILSYNLGKGEIDTMLNNLKNNTYPVENIDNIDSLQESLQLVKYYIDEPKKLSKYTQDELMNAFQVVRNNLPNSSKGTLKFGEYSNFAPPTTDSRLYNYDWLLQNIR